MCKWLLCGNHGISKAFTKCLVFAVQNLATSHFAKDMAEVYVSGCGYSHPSSLYMTICLMAYCVIDVCKGVFNHINVGYESIVSA